MIVLSMNKRIELVILENIENNGIENFLSENIGSIYVQVSPNTLSESRKILTDNQFSTRLIVVPQNDTAKYYIYGKKKKNNGVFNENCKNTVLTAKQYLEKIIEASSNADDLVITDDSNVMRLLENKNRKSVFYGKIR